MTIAFLDSLPPPLLSALLTIVITLIGYLLRPRARIHHAVTHGFTHTIKGQPQADPPTQTAVVNTKTFLFRNVGRGVANNLEIVFNWKPLQYEIWPQRRYTEEANPDDRMVIKVDSLNPREFFAIEIIDVKELPFLLSVRCLDGQSLAVNMAPTRIYPMWINLTIALFLLAGLYQLIQMAVLVLRAVFHL